MTVKLFFCNFIISFACLVAFSQHDDCSLDIGNEDSETIKKIFQLNDDQSAKMDNWIGELQVKNREIEDQITVLFNSHPQSTEADLHNLAKKYAKLSNELVLVALDYDQKMLGLFNEKQYEFYAKLCKEAHRKPLRPNKPEEEQEAPE